MKVSVQSPSETTRELTIEISVERVAGFIEQESDRVRKRVQLPGFRKGKAPLRMVRAQYGRQIEASAIENAINENYSEAISAENLNPIGPANISNMSYEPGKPLKFTATIEIEPDFSVGELHDIRVDKEEPEVTPELFEDTLKKIQHRFGTVSTKESPADTGDQLLVDIEEIDPATGLTLIGKKYPDQSLRLGEHRYGPGFDEQLVGVKVGEAKRVVQQMEQYLIANPDQQQNNRPPEVHYRVIVKKVETVEIPEIDDKLAQAMDYDNVETMRDGIKVNLLAQLQDASLERFRAALEREVVRIAEPPVPQSMVERYLDHLIENVKQLSATPPDLDKLREENMENARKKIQWYLIRQKLIGQKGFEVLKQEIDEYIQNYAQEHNLDRKRLQIEYRSGKKREDLENSLLDNKIFEYLESKAKIRTIKKR